MSRMNCWKYMNCGREPGGSKAKELGVCQAAIEKELNGVNEGENGGRACWAIAGTLCGGKVQGSFAVKVGNCMNCDFFQLVVRGEGKNYCGVHEILKKLKEHKEK